MHSFPAREPNKFYPALNCPEKMHAKGPALEENLQGRPFPFYFA